MPKFCFAFLLFLLPVLETVVDFRVRRFLEPFCPIFASFSGGHIQEVDITPRKKGENWLKRAQKSTEPEINDSLLGSEIEIVYHIATLNNWKEIAREQLEALEISGLAKASRHITVTVVGDQIHAARSLLSRAPFHKKIEVIHAGNDLHAYEFPAIETVKRIAQVHRDAKIFYLHTKGVTHFRQATEENVLLWRRYLEYFTIYQWKTCVEALDSVNLCGVEWLERPELHFSGNFWWARADYLRTCHGTAKRRGRWDCEYFIGSGFQPTYKSLHQSGKDLYGYGYTPNHYR